MCVLYVEIMRAGRIELGWAHDVFIIAYHTFMHFSCIRTSLFYHIDIDCVWFSSACLSLSLFLLVSLRMTPKHKSIPSRNPLCSRAASSSNPTPSSVWFLDEKACQDFSRTFLEMGFIQNTKSSFRIFPIETFPLSSTVGVGSLFITSRTLVPPWSYMSFTLICTNFITLYLISSLAFEVRALYSLQILYLRYYTFWG